MKAQGLVAAVLDTGILGCGALSLAAAVPKAPFHPGVQVHEYDCLLLEFVFGNRPDDAQKVRAYVLETIASDPGLQQTELVFLGLFGRCCRIMERPDDQVGSPV